MQQLHDVCDGIWFQDLHRAGSDRIVKARRRAAFLSRPLPARLDRYQCSAALCVPLAIPATFSGSSGIVNLIFATVALVSATIAYRQWRDNRGFHKQNKLQRDQHQEEMLREQQEQAARRERLDINRDDFDAARRNLNRLQRASSDVIESGPLTEARMAAYQLADVSIELRQIAERIAGLHGALTNAAHKAKELSATGIPETDPPLGPLEGAKLGMSQVTAAQDARTALEAARTAIQAEWGG